MSFDYAAKIQGLIAHAENEANSPEARASYRAKAEQLMREYRVAEEDLIAQDPTAIVPMIKTIIIMDSNAYANPLRQEYVALWQEVALHAGIRYAQKIQMEDGTQRLVAIAYGYEGDLRYAEFIWTAARLVFLARIDARVNPAISDQENCYLMRNSGMKRNDVANALWGSAYDDGHAHGKVQRLYLAECALRGEEPRVAGRGLQVNRYRAAYASEFVWTFGNRLRQAKDAAGTKGGGLELHGRKERVNEAFYADFPDRRPMSSEEAKAYQAAYQAARVAELAECLACPKSTHASGKCRRHRPTEITAAQRAAQDKRWNSPEARAGSANGAAAARSIDLQRGFNRENAAQAAPERTALGG